ncbi:USP6 N-terminal-like protein [Trichinella pseudospiralis]|uniref:USP6 N-terminal-like protein n=1 Tax=Trichinella pseudospiralis TaxID=6337 RepID=A0A0V1FG92_TRIPS|nr:USP6 N-terminal-like protein [Trichinella pseudospiralis]
MSNFGASACLPDRLTGRLMSSLSIFIHACNLCKFRRRPAFKLANRAAIPASVLEKHQYCAYILIGHIFAVRLSLVNDKMSSSSLTDDSDDLPSGEVGESVVIFQKYDKNSNRARNDPDFEMYKHVDRYGFALKDDVQLGESGEEEKVKRREIRREKKWLKLLRSWSQYQGTARLSRSIYKGIPQKFRSEVWRRLLNIDGQKQIGLYDKLRLAARLRAKDTKQIDLDINRTYRNHVFFRQRYGFKQRSLLNVLTAYSMFNRELGYCQGMNHLAALLLMYFSEEDAFWALHILMCDNIHAMHGFFVPGFPKLLRFQQHHDRIVKARLPRLRNHMESQGAHAALYSTKWFFQCFLDRVPFSLALRLWDIFMLEGDVVLTGMAFTILKLHEKMLMKLNFEQLMEFLQSKLEKNFGFANDTAIYALHATMATLRRRKQLSPPPASRHETPTELVGASALQQLADAPCSLSMNLNSLDYSEAGSTVIAFEKVNASYENCSHSLPVRNETISSDKSSVKSELAKMKTCSTSTVDVLTAERTLHHVPSYYDNLSEDYCCACSPAPHFEQQCTRGKDNAAQMERTDNNKDDLFCIEAGPNYITRIRIDAQ